MSKCLTELHKEQKNESIKAIVMRAEFKLLKCFPENVSFHNLMWGK